VKLLQKLGFLAAACALLVATFAVIGPQAVHAVVATLVQVSNPAAAPALTQNVPTFASQTVTLYTNTTPGDFTDIIPFAQLTPQGGIVSGFNYVTPSNESLVITSIEFIPYTGTGKTDLDLYNTSASPHQGYEGWRNMPAGSITNLQFPNGIVIGPNISPGLGVGPLSSTTSGFFVYLHGYLTPN
jgi:hypothetical protein